MKLRDVLMGTTILRAPDTGGGDGQAVDAEFQDLDDLIEPADEGLEADPAEGLDPEDLEPVEPGHEPEPQRRREPSRTERDIAELRRRTQAAEDELRREREERLRDQQSRHQRESEADYQRRLEMMTPEERLSEQLRRSEALMQQRLDRMEFESKDQADKAQFDALCAKNKAYDSVADKVETVLADLRRSGVTAPRQVIAEREIGRLAVERASRNRPRAEREAAAARTREGARPAAQRSDTRGADTARGLSPADAARKRLEGVKI